MASKSWTVTYALARIQNAMETAVGHLTGSASSSYSTALLAGLEALKTKELTTVVCMSGTAMLPTLNRLHENEGIVDRLLMRCLPSHTGKRIYRGDIVAFKPPPGTDGSLLVRRVAALEGDEMVSDDPEDQAFRLPSGHCWVLADNEDMRVAEARDSRTFGPLPVDNVLGRILYYVRSRTEHGRVDSDALPTDTAIIEAELDVDKIAQTPC